LLESGEISVVDNVELPLVLGGNLVLAPVSPVILSAGELEILEPRVFNSENQYVVPGECLVCTEQEACLVISSTGFE